MTQTRTLANRFGNCVAAAMLLAGTSTSLWGQVTAPSIYTTAITVQGEVLGEEFADWAASGIPVVDADPVDNPGDIDIANIQVANDSEFIYIHATLHNTTTITMSNIFLAFDTDQNTATGFDVLQIGEIGSEIGYQTDYPFAQHELSYNLGVSFSGGPLTPPNGGALIYPFWGGIDAPPAGIAIEWAVPLDIIVQYPAFLGGPGPGFPNDSFNFVVYTDQGLADITQVISYTLAPAPEGQPGDFDGDDDVDGRDFLIWQRGGSPTALSADDLADWQDNFGTGPLLAAVAVPEVSSIFLATIGLTALGLRRRRA